MVHGMNSPANEQSVHISQNESLKLGMKSP